MPKEVPHISRPARVKLSSPHQDHRLQQTGRSSTANVTCNPCATRGLHHFPAGAPQIQQRVATGPAPRSAGSKPQRRVWRKILMSSMEADVPRFAYLIQSRLPEASAAITAHVAALVSRHPELPPPTFERDYLPWVVTAVSDPGMVNDTPVPPELAEAARSRKAGSKGQRKRRRRFNTMLFTPTHYGHLTATMFNLYIDALPDEHEYPPRGEWVAENKFLFDLWSDYLATMKLPDERKARAPTHLVSGSKWKYDMPADLNFQIFDRATGELVFRMVRNFCPSSELLDHGRDVVHRAAVTQRSIRVRNFSQPSVARVTHLARIEFFQLEDRGVIIQIGFSAGSRKAPEFGWVRNTLSKKTDQDAARRQVSSFMTAFWLMAKHAFPSEVIEDFEEFHRKYDFPRFHPEWPLRGDTVHGPLKLSLGRGELEWDNVELAPGSGVMVQRYARPVHLEHQPHGWAINWTTLREGSDPQGGNFVLAKYGVLIRLSANSAFAWKPEHWHATTLANFEPRDDGPQREYPTFNQHSVAFVTSPRAGTIYQKWAAANGGANSWGAHLCEAGEEIYR